MKATIIAIRVPSCSGREMEQAFNKLSVNTTGFSAADPLRHELSRKFWWRGTLHRLLQRQETVWFLGIASIFRTEIEVEA